ncbi:DNA methyltransferase [Roseiflexus castenholzii]|uniref:DNA methyltransferase n=1 Tax=Roseiflexus castenholzii TaxID=120962 RepID=UPI003C7D11AF
MNTKENPFFDAMKGIFIGVPVEGESGYINLMRIKARYFERVIMQHLQKEIEDALQPFPNFREELFDKLYTFFRRYFTENGSIGFFFTPYHQSVYEQVYTDDQDVILFWKTARLYYVKTDRLFRSMTVEVDGFKFFFDVSTLEHKKANEKRSLVFEFKERLSDGAFAFTVQYAERGRQTNLAQIRRAIKDELGLKNDTPDVPSEETLEKAFRLFERRSEVDFFICKDAKSFLREQFDLWLWQYLLGKPGEKPETQWTEDRLKQLQALKRIAYRVIDFIAAFEDELVRIWNKPKFVLRSAYVITLDHIYDRKPELLDRILEYPHFKKVEASFTAESLWEEDLTGRCLHSRYRFLPLDTRYLKDLELEILSLFDNLDEALDGWLIKSENYQALNAMLPKFRERVKCIYIDPPYNTGSDEFIYRDRYQHSSWLSMMYDRLRLAREWMREDGAIFVSIDDGEQDVLRKAMEAVFGDENFVNNIIWQKKFSPQNDATWLSDNHDFLLLFAKHKET